MNEDKLQKKINQGQSAGALMRDEAFATACKALEAEYIKTWAGTNPSQRGEREAMWISCQVLADVRRHLSMMHQDGKLAQRELEDMMKKVRQAA